MKKKNQVPAFFFSARSGFEVPCATSPLAALAYASPKGLLSTEAALLSLVPTSNRPC